MPDSLMIRPEQLNDLLMYDEVVVIDCRFSLADSNEGRRLYNEGHIPGAFYLHLNDDLSSPVSEHGGRHPLPSAQHFTEVIQLVGVNNDSTVVIYDDHRLGFAARLWWLLQCFGHSSIHILDGGYSAWLAAGYSVEQQLLEAKRGNFTGAPRLEQVVDYDYVKGRSWDGKEHVLIDSREAVRFRGEQEPIDPVAGCIPGAVNFPWLEVTNDQGQLREITVQEQRLADVVQAQEIVVYCGSGVTACVNLLSLFLIGREDAKLYSGSWSDWCSHLK